MLKAWGSIYDPEEFLNTFVKAKAHGKADLIDEQMNVVRSLLDKYLDNFHKTRVKVTPGIEPLNSTQVLEKGNYSVIHEKITARTRSRAKKLPTMNTISETTTYPSMVRPVIPS